MCYYPFGLKIAGISSHKLADANEGNTDNNYGYQGDYSEFDVDLGWNDFELRNYDSQIGRWIQQDPYEQYPSPYVGMGNDPVNNVDPDGGLGIDFGAISTLGRIGVTAGGAVVGFAIDKLTGGNGWTGAAIGGAVALGATFIPPFSIEGVGNALKSAAPSIAIQTTDVVVKRLAAETVSRTVTNTLPNAPTSIPKNAGPNLPPVVNKPSPPAFSAAPKTALPPPPRPAQPPSIRPVPPRRAGFNIDNAITTLDARAGGHSQHACAKYVRIAIQAGGINTANHPLEARQYGPYLHRWGFIQVNPSNYTPARGDIRVFQPYSGGNSAGHIDMFNGNNWASDFRENNNMPGTGYAIAQNYQIFRWQ